MRLDVFLKTSRLVKRRTIARELCDNGRVLLAGQPAKASKEVKPGDILTLMFSSRVIRFEIASLAQTASKRAGQAALYTVLSESRVKEEND